MSKQERPRLWELAADRRPCPFTQDEQWFDDWAALRDNTDQHDDSLNIVIWWDWYPADTGEDSDTLTLMVALPNKERVYPWSAPVTRDQEPEIHEWLRRRLNRLIGYWQVRPSAGDAR